MSEFGVNMWQSVLWSFLMKFLLESNIKQTQKKQYAKRMFNEMITHDKESAKRTIKYAKADSCLQMNVSC